MDISDFKAHYAQMSDDALLVLWADRNTLVPEAVMVLDGELQKRDLNRQKATRIKNRFDVLAARRKKGDLSNQIAAAKYERNMRHFVGWQEPEFYSPYGARDIRKTFAHFRHKYRVWKAFRNHTGHWPVFSIWFHFLSWVAGCGAVVFVFVWAEGRRLSGAWTTVAVFGCILILMGVRELGARQMRKLDWKRFGGGLDEKSQE
jgi:hypothetical protein